MFAPQFYETMRMIGSDGLTGYQRRARACIASKLAKNPNAMKEHGQKMLEAMGPIGLKKRAETLRRTRSEMALPGRKAAIKVYRNRIAYLSRLNDLSDLPNFEKWGRGQNKGYELDHMFSVNDGFEAKIDVSIIAHKANLRFIPKTENRAKWHRSCLTLKELQEAIKC